MPFDLVHRHAYEVLVDLGVQRLAQMRRVGLAQDAERARRRHHDDRLGLARRHRGVETAGKILQEGAFRLVLPVGLLHGAACLPDGIDRAAWDVGALLARLEVLVLIDLLGLQVRKYGIPNILEQQRFLSIAHDHPLVLVNLQLAHGNLLAMALRGASVAAPRGINSRTAIQLLPSCSMPSQLLPSSSRRAMTCAWISAAPSKIDRMRASHNRRDTGYSRAKPLPPWICTALSAAAQATRAAISFAMPASRSQRRPESFSRAA